MRHKPGTKIFDLIVDSFPASALVDFEELMYEICKIRESYAPGVDAATRTMHIFGCRLCKSSWLIGF